jgi:uncharacterized protein YndB with AHSA1/START domain
MRIAALLLIAAALPAQAEVKSVSDGGFESVNVTRINASPAKLFATLGQPGRWWSSDHTYSGDARNMTMRLVPGGCFCEVIPKDRSVVEHMRVVFVQPGKMLRLSGGLGPLQGEGVAGALTWTIKAVDGGSEITQTYVVGGYIRGGTKAFAPIVDRVLAEQLSRLKAHLEAASN